MIKPKFLASLFLHLMVLALFLSLVQKLDGITLTPWMIAASICFSGFYYTLLWLDLYSQPYHHYLMNAFSSIVRDMAITLAVMVALEYVIVCVSDARLKNLLFIDGLLVFGYAALHIALFLWIRNLANLGFFSKNVMLVGSYDDRVPVDKLFQNINGTKTFVGQLTNSGSGWRYRASLDEAFQPIENDIESFLFRKHVSELIICLDDRLAQSAIARCAQWCRRYSIGYYLIPDISRLPATYPWGMRFKDVPQIERFCPARDSLLMVSFKRLFDIAASAMALVLLSPVYLAIAMLIKHEDGGPVFYVSTRVGIHGKHIRFVKFRSMVMDAEKRKAELLALNERPDGPLFKLKDDPRVTRIGRVLRKTSLDEIPQFWNVLRGDMSLIGPRPHLPSEVACYSDIDNLRLECIPGIACLPQVRGRDDIGFREWVDLDLEYRRDWTLGYDMKILFNVARVVLSPILRRRA